MASETNLVIFRTDWHNVSWLNGELFNGRLRQGWGPPGLSLATEDGQPLEKWEWEAAHREVADWGDPSPRRYAILVRMTKLKEGDIVVIPKMPDWDTFTVARVSGNYRFDAPSQRDLEDDRYFGHIIPVDPASIRQFGKRANNEAFLVSALFSRANHRDPVSFCYGEEQVAAVRKLLEMQSSEDDKPKEELTATAMDTAFWTAAAMFADTVAAEWNGKIFEDAVRQRFIELGYVERTGEYKRYDGKGGDMDMVMSPPPSQYGPFLPEEIAVQAKWKQGRDEYDVDAVKQIVEWAKSQGFTGTKCVISSASRFTREVRNEAEKNDVELIGGLQTMCFLLGLADRYREDWERGNNQNGESDEEET